MKIAISSEGKDLDSKPSSMFGRCSYFVIVELSENKFNYDNTIENIGANQTSGAGIKAAKLIGEENVNSLITDSVGPKAFDALKEWDINIYKAKGDKNRNNIEKLLNDELDRIENPNTSPKKRSRGRR